ncbi:BsuPI-related putative proteinase inhibitor [Halomicrococcus gelatinilyticus]|uniref:BsuPI-related putative proteinase inhibitor n=1 Tax=Halomicrococcus gelatinilyticus TaxID=1702103 RepID=UPI002E0DA0DB
MTLESELTATPSDDAVTFELVVRNAGDDPVEVTFRSGLGADFTVLDVDAEGEDDRADEVEVWRASEGRMFTQALRPETFERGAERTYRGEWPDPEPGEYEVVATLAVTDEAVEEQVAARTDVSV